MLAFLVATAALAMLGVGAWLSPDRSGISTHTQLGLAGCQFEVRTGLPCPSCGFTTAVTWFAHGNVLASIYTQPMGFVIALLAAVSVCTGYYVAATGRPVYRLLMFVPGRKWLIGLLAGAIAAWAWKIAIHLTGHDHWPPI